MDWAVLCIEKFKPGPVFLWQFQFLLRSYFNLKAWSIDHSRLSISNNLMNGCHLHNTIYSMLPNWITCKHHTNRAATDSTVCFLVQSGKISLHIFLDAVYCMYSFTYTIVNNKHCTEIPLMIYNSSNSKLLQVVCLSDEKNIFSAHF